MSLRQVFQKLENGNISPKEATAEAAGRLLLQSHALPLLSQSQRDKIDDFNENEEKESFLDAVNKLTTVIEEFEMALTIYNTATNAAIEVRQELLSKHETLLSEGIRTFVGSLNTYFQAEDKTADDKFLKAFLKLEKAVETVINVFDPTPVRAYIVQLHEAMTEIKKKKINLSRLMLVDQDNGANKTIQTEALLLQQITSLPTLMFTYYNNMRNTSAEKQSELTATLQKQMLSFTTVVDNLMIANAAAPTSDSFASSLCKAIAASEVVFGAAHGTNQKQTVAIANSGIFNCLQEIEKGYLAAFANVKKFKGLDNMVEAIAQHVESYQADLNMTRTDKLKRALFGKK